MQKSTVISSGTQVRAVTLLPNITIADNGHHERSSNQPRELSLSWKGPEDLTGDLKRRLVIGGLHRMKASTWRRRQLGRRSPQLAPKTGRTPMLRTWTTSYLEGETVRVTKGTTWQPEWDTPPPPSCVVSGQRAFGGPAASDAPAPYPSTGGEGNVGFTTRRWNITALTTLTDRIEYQDPVRRRHR